MTKFITVSVQVVVMCLLCGRGEPRRPTRNTTLAPVITKSSTEKVSTSKCQPTKNLRKWKNISLVKRLINRSENLSKNISTEADYSFNCSRDLKKPNCCCKNETDCFETVAGHLLVFEKYLNEMKVRLTPEEQYSNIIAKINVATDSLKDVERNISYKYKVKGNSSIITCDIGPDFVNRRKDLLAQFAKEITVFLKLFPKNIRSMCKVKDNSFQGNSTRRGESGGSTVERGGSSGERRRSSGEKQGRSEQRRGSSGERKESYEENKGNSGGRGVSSGGKGVSSVGKGVSSGGKGVNSGGGGRNTKGRGGSSGGRRRNNKGREGSSRGRGGSSGVSTNGVTE